MVLVFGFCRDEGEKPQQPSAKATASSGVPQRKAWVLRSPEATETIRPPETVAAALVAVLSPASAWQ